MCSCFKVGIANGSNAAYVKITFSDEGTRIVPVQIQSVAVDSAMPSDLA